ncbi:MAG: NAD(P)H-hydrate epimerase [Phycisphaerae bacterium]|nr:NAD(P)H-hydrate epimerase [Phycisphaerae bacterium]
MLVLTTAASRELDRAAQERFGIPGIVLMENAAIGMAAIARKMLIRNHAARVTIVCGPGNNGGDGYAIARHLANAGSAITIVAVGSPQPGTDAATNAAIAERMGLEIQQFQPRGHHVAGPPIADRSDLIIDALFGSGLDRPVVGLALGAISAMNASGVPVLAVDLPSGLDGDLGLPLGESVRATVTAVTVAPRPACFIDAARIYLGDWKVVDIGAPVALVREFSTTT